MRGRAIGIDSYCKNDSLCFAKENPKPPGTYYSRKSYINEDRSSRLAFLDGGRGT